MSAIADQELAELRRANAELRDTLAQRNSEYGERIEQQAATIDVLKAMSSSPGDPQPVFDLIVRHANELCDGTGCGIFEYDDSRVHIRATSLGAVGAASQSAWLEYLKLFPMAPTRGSFTCRAILDRQIVHIIDTNADVAAHPLVKALGYRSQLSIPLMCDRAAIGAISLGGPLGGFSDSQIALLQTFAEQAVIAITSAETYRALQTRTSDLQETLEYQTATSDVLKVISRSTFDLQPVLDTVAATAARLCDADQAAIFRHEGGLIRFVTNCGFPPEYEAHLKGLGTYASDLSPQNVTTRAIREGRTVQINDVALIPGYAEQAITLGKQRTSLGVPLLREGEAIGVIVLARRHVEPFTDRQIELVSTFADQAVIAIESTRLLTEQREALEQQTATAEVLQVINSSPGDLAPVLDAMLQRVTQLCDAAFGIANTYDGERFRTAALHRVPAPLAQLWRSAAAPPPGPNSPLTRIASGEDIIHIEDFAATLTYHTGELRHRAMVELGGARSYVAVALRRQDGALLGTLAAYRQEVRPFSDKEIGLLQNFAAQAVIAMENARLLDQLHQRTRDLQESLEYQTATSDVLKAISRAAHDLDTVLNMLIVTAVGLCNASHGQIWRRDGEIFRYATSHMNVPAYREKEKNTEIRAGRGTLIGRVALDNKPVLITDAWTDPEYEDDARLAQARSMLGVPLLRDGELIGAFALARRDPVPFTERQVEVVSVFADQTVIAMENARLLGELRQRQEELRVTFENMGDGVAMFNETQNLVAWNGKFQEIFDLPDVLLEQHRTYEEHLNFLAARGDFGASVDTAEQIRGLVSSTGQPYGYERTRPDGRVIEIRRNPVPDGGFVLIFSDITERKRSEAEIRAARDAAEAAYRDLKATQASLIQAEKMASLGQLTAGIAHEIKNPLNFVNNFADLSGDLLDELNDAVAGNLQAEIDELTATLKGNLAKIAEHGRRADGIVRSMLEHSRGSSGERRAVDPNALVDEALNLAYHGARARSQSFSITLQREFGESIAPIMLAPQDVTRVLLNLLSNGFYAAREQQRLEAVGFEPTLKVSTRELDDAVEIRVRDNGIGIPPEIKDRLFQPFFTTKPTGEGTGLGLSMSYDIVTQQHGGSISVDSEVGEYSEFTVRLPRHP